VLISWDNLFIFFPDLGLDGEGEDNDLEEEGGDHESFLEAMASLDGKKK
jgi:hypothetical protein